MSPFCHETDLDQGGGSAEEDIEDQLGSPERLDVLLAAIREAVGE